MFEHLPQLNITQSELAHRVADYFDNLLAQRDAILATYDLTPETAEKFCILQSTDADREKMLALYEKMVYVIEHKQIPPTEVLEQERSKEQDRINEFFGKDADIEVPPLPPTITPERIEQWKLKRFELRYLPPLILEEDDDYPGWKKKPARGSLVDFFACINDIVTNEENKNNPHLHNLSPDQLPGRWMLIDERPTPDDGGEIPAYEDDDDIRTILQKLAQNSIVNKSAEYGTRYFIHPETFKYSMFWKPFYEYLGIKKEEAVIRLPRVIEHMMFVQDRAAGDAFLTSEWSEEYLANEWRLFLGFFTKFDWKKGIYVNSVDMGKDDIGFRPLVVFSSH